MNCSWDYSWSLKNANCGLKSWIVAECWKPNRGWKLQSQLSITKLNHCWKLESQLSVENGDWVLEAEITNHCWKVELQLKVEHCNHSWNFLLVNSNSVLETHYTPQPPYIPHVSLFVYVCYVVSILFLFLSIS